MAGPTRTEMAALNGMIKKYFGSSPTKQAVATHVERVVKAAEGSPAPQKLAQSFVQGPADLLQAHGGSLLMAASPHARPPLGSPSTTVHPGMFKVPGATPAVQFHMFSSSAVSPSKPATHQA